MSTDRRTARAWIEVQAASLRRNFRRIRDAVGPNVPMIPMVKADAYGVGARQTVGLLEPEEPWAYGVAAISEGRTLREDGLRRRVIVFSPLTPDDYGDALDAELTVCVSSLDGLGSLEAAARSRGRPAPFHLEVDTGMGRAGVPAAEADRWAGPVREAHAGGRVRLEGCFTHFHSADEVGGPGVDEQLAAFRGALTRLEPPAGCLVHVANSAAALRLGRDGGVGGVRPGIFLYGGGVGDDLPAPEPVVSVRARIVLIKNVAAGSTAGYGATYRADTPERWATIAIGYGDGIPRALGNRGQVLVKGRRVPLVGRVSMDLVVANISGLDGVEPGDVATLVGRDGPAEIPVDEVAELAGTISYEVLTGLGPRLPRIWMDDDV